jgi:4-hydroxybenzoate polyprenyltransferase
LDFKKFLKLIMVEQTLFGLPFAYIGVLFADGRSPDIWIKVTIAFISARIAGMSFNRVIDSDIDSKNPRTIDRLIPSGELNKMAVWLTAIISSIILIIVSFFINDLCFHLSFLAVILLYTYSYFKRFSSSSHLYLGFVESAAPIGGYLAVTGEFDLIPFILAVIIMTWIAGLDIIYSLQDLEFDRENNLHSIPVKFGENKSKIFSLIFYFISVFAMILAGLLSHNGIIYFSAITIVSIIFIFQQSLVRCSSRVDRIKIFFKTNMIISPIILTGIILDKYFMI